VLTSLAAILFPTLYAGRLSEDRRAAKPERVQIRPHAGPLFDPDFVVEHVVGHAAAVVETFTSGSRTSWYASRRGHDHNLVTFADRRVASVAITSSASYPSASTAEPEGLDQPAYELDLLEKRLCVVGRPAL